MKKNAKSPKAVAPVKTAARLRAKTMERIDDIDRLEASSMVRAEATFLRCSRPQRMKGKRSA